jgi:glycosyltransferase involved in cell wall biosynthesis
VLHIHQINLQPSVGGGEVYTRWFTRALADAGAEVTLYVDGANPFWNGLSSGLIRVERVVTASQILERLPARDAVILTQSRIPASLMAEAANNHVLTGFAHMPMLGRSGEEFARYLTVFTVSQYCIRLLLEAGISQVYPEPLYGTCAIDQARHAGNLQDNDLTANSPFDWDTRKGRDRALSIVEPFARALMPRRRFVRRKGLTLGVVSLLSPIKQFPLLFSLLARELARFPEVSLEIFGRGGYAQVRDLKRALAPISGRVRYWGFQEHVEAVYANIDYLMTGLPEKEALGINVLEAQALGTPVLAPNAEPFTETVVQGKSGFLYRDPREDSGKEFGRVLEGLVHGRPRPDPRLETHHLARFSYAALVDRASAVIDHLSSVAMNFSRGRVSSG